MTTSMIIGTALGILIAVVSAIVVNLVIRFAVSSPPNWQYVGGIIAQLLALAGFWTGGTWITGHMLQVPDQLQLETAYWVALVTGFVIGILPMLIWLVLLVGVMTRVALQAEIDRWGG